MNTLTAFSVADVLDRAMSEIRRRGLCQGDFYRGDRDDGRLCIDGALRLAVTGRPDTLRMEMTPEQGRLHDRVTVRVVQAIRDRDGTCAAVAGAVPNWNDERGRTVEDVLAVLRAARELAGGGS